jgi:hypothetical protein
MVQVNDGLGCYAPNLDGNPCVEEEDFHMENADSTALTNPAATSFQLVGIINRRTASDFDRLGKRVIVVHKGFMVPLVYVPRNAIVGTT